MVSLHEPNRVKHPIFVINENGIWDRTTKQDEVKWEQIAEAYPLDIYKQKFVSIVVDDTFVTTTNLYKWAAKFNEATGTQRINLHISQLEIDEHILTDFINEIINVEKANRHTVLKKYFGN